MTVTITITQTPSVPLTSTQHPGGRRRRRPAQPPDRPGEARPAVRSQRDEALDEANALRSRKANEKRDMAALTPPGGCEHAAAALADGEPWALACTTAELLTAVHGLGRNVAREICVTADVGLGVRFDSLGEHTDTALAAIVAALRDRAANGPQQRRKKPSGPTDPDQVSRALRRGNAIRVARGQLRAELLVLGDPAGRERFREILTTLTESDALAGLRLFDALDYIPGFGAAKIQRVRDVTQIKGAFTLAGVARMRPNRRAVAAGRDRRPVGARPADRACCPAAARTCGPRGAGCGGARAAAPQGHALRRGRAAGMDRRAQAAADGQRQRGGQPRTRRARSPGARWSACACRSSGPTRPTACTQAGDWYELPRRADVRRRLPAAMGRPRPLRRRTRGARRAAAAWRVIATDNAAVFDEAFRRARRTRRLAATARPGTMCEIANRVDGLLCSSKRRVLKAEDPDAFFGEWLARKGLGFADAVLVDDREDNRSAFEVHGGSTIAWSPDAAIQAAALDAIRAFAQPADTLAATPA